ncbi:hypothetical protein GLOIN_2v1846435 [Rhizophagus irregularis DAOM 181602=DAOM 197198]|nr:hypothetical protein GLOIN_2v1846435 [Rhizophagus irregularis DAOM 181602=DAOM 197198]
MKLSETDCFGEKHKRRTSFKKFNSAAIFIGIATMWQFLNRKISDGISARDAFYATEAQKILSMFNHITARLNIIEEARRNDFGRISSEINSINSSIEALQNKMIRHYTLAVTRRIQPIETDQLSMASPSSQSRASISSSSGSSAIIFRGISLTVWTRFKQLFDQIRDEKRLNSEEMCLHVATEIRALGGKIKKNTIQGFYERNITKSDGYISTLDDIGLWVDSKNNENLDSNSA